MKHPLIVATATAAIVLLSGCSGASSHPAPSANNQSLPDKIGSWPTFLPTPSNDPAGITGSTSDPAMSFPGNLVTIDTPTGVFHVDVEGPSYPSSTKVGAEHVHNTFTITFTGVKGSIDLHKASFDLLDHAGTVHSLSPIDQTRMPVGLSAGTTKTVKLLTNVPSGEGLLRLYLAPNHAAAAWDYIAETD